MSACIRAVSTRDARAAPAPGPSGRCSAPRSNSSAYAPTAATGVRSSCDASATKRRRRSSDACCLAKASSMRSSIVFSAMPSRPTSVRSSARSTRRLELAAGDVRPPCSRCCASGRSPTRTSQRPSPTARASTAAVTKSSVSSNRCSVAFDVVERQRDHEQRVVRQPLAPGRGTRRFAAGGVDGEERLRFRPSRGRGPIVLGQVGAGTS